MKTNILYLGAFPPSFLVKRTDGRIDSLYRATEPLFTGLRSRGDVCLKVITSPDIPSYPSGPLFLKREINKVEDVTLVSSLNISFIKQLWTIASMTIEVIRYIRKCNEKVVIIIPYIVFRHVFSLRLLHHLFPNKVVQVCVVPDIFFPSKWINRKINRWTERMASKFDGFILYTQKMAGHLQIRDEKYVVIEGYRVVPERQPITNTDFCVVYAGSLNLNYGVGRLVEAMRLIEDKTIHLHLYGEGSAENYVKNEALHDNRIHYHGRVSNAEAADAIYSASVLVNPRNSNDGQFTDYSFPSKDIEYMSTGIPTLLCKLPGMPKEYYGHFIDIGNGSPEEIAKGIMCIKQMSKDERNKIGMDSRSFIIDRMDCRRQAGIIMGMIKTLI